jgi:hypothetical protein
MDMNAYALEMLARERLVELRAKRERLDRVRAATVASPSLRVALGRALIGLGQRLQAVRTSAPGAVIRG